ncbi:sel1 repeat family protein [Massilia sp. 9096]|uniref:sel1 repeat family protein n=1 Tax=Massilia sp. 9096 TaxID=1500894 RepID=UPI000AC959CD|nr:sel1 repeat family protein [Massilia sp. 9096]
MLLPCRADAVDMDVGLNIEARKAEAAPACKRLRRADAPEGPDDYYRLGLCLAYGLGGPEKGDEGVASLRRAASADLVEAQMALADFLQAASPTQPQDAVYWYRRAEKLGDARAGGRADHLERRIALDAQRPTPPPDTIIDPTPMELQALYRQGYHCHAVFGEQWCHIADDI